jgi:hypothetical protein
MVLAIDGFTLAGLIVGFLLWIGLFFGARRWGSPGEDSATADEPSTTDL